MFRKFNKKLVSLLICSFVLSLSFSSVVPHVVNAKENIRIAIGVDGQDVVRKYVKQFEATHPGAKIDLSIIGWGELHQKLVVSFAGGKPFDIMYSGPAWVVEFAEAGWLTPLDNRITSETLDQTWKTLVEGLTYKGHIWAQPLYFGAMPTVYNKEVLRKGGLIEFPKTWKEFVEISKRLQAAGIVKYGTRWEGMESGSGANKNFTMLLDSFGGEFFDDKGNVVFYESGGLDLFKFIVDALYKDKIVDPNSLEEIELSLVMRHLAKEKYVSLITWPYFITWAKSNIENFEDLGVTLVPGARGVRSGNFGYGQALGISQKCKNKDLAWEIVKLLTQDKVQKERALAAADLPATKALYKDPDLVKFIPWLPAMGEQYKYTTMVQLPWFGEFDVLCNDTIQSLVCRKKSPEEAAHAMQESLEKLQKEYGFPIKEE